MHYLCMGEMEHKILDYLEHLWPYVSGFFIVMGTVISFLWKDRHANKKRMVNNEKQYAQLAWMIENKVATKEELSECGKEKDKQHTEGIKDVLSELQGVRGEVRHGNDNNSQQHQDIHKEISGVLKVIAGLHSGD